MNGSTSKNGTQRVKSALDWLLKDWVWEVFLVVLVAPVVVNTFLSLGNGASV
jgi:hypothetical protein